MIFKIILTSDSKNKGVDSCTARLFADGVHMYTADSLTALKMYVASAKVINLKLHTCESI